MTDEEKILQYLKLFIAEDAITELRALPVSRESGQTMTGLYDYAHLHLMAEHAVELEKTGQYKGIYFMPNPIKREKYTSCVRPNSVVPARTSISDVDIDERRWLLIDVDPKRSVKGEVSASKAEKDAAWNVVCRVRGIMASAGYSEPIVASSGNGWHLSYPISLDSTEDNKIAIKAILTGLHDRCSETGVAEVDTTIHNSGRIWKLYGTVARKGVETDDRRHRRSGVISSPATPSPLDANKNSNACAALLSMWAKQEQEQADIEARLAMPENIRRADAYLAAYPGAVEGDGGNLHTYLAAQAVVEGFAVDDDNAFLLLKKWNDKCDPPWDDAGLIQKIKCAKDRIKDSGYLLNRDRPVNQAATSIPRHMQQRQAYTGIASVPEVIAATEDDPDATATDLVALHAQIEWLWEGWIQVGTLTCLAADAGCGKTRFCADLARRLALGLPLPDGTTNPHPVGTKCMFIAADSQWAELGSLPTEFGFSGDCLLLNGRRSNPYGGTNLDTPEDLADFERRIIRTRPAIIFIDTCGNATDKDTCKTSDAKAFFKPLAEIAVRQRVAIVLVTHLNRGGQVLGARIVGAVRQVISLSYGEEGSPKNLRILEISKTNSKKPNQLHTYMGDSGNDYTVVETQSRTVMTPVALQTGHLMADMEWLSAYMRGGREVGTMERLVGLCRQEADSAGIGAKRLYKAKNRLGLIEFSVEGRKWWRLDEGDTRVEDDEENEGDEGDYTID
jgi:hypothetical protein